MIIQLVAAAKRSAIDHRIDRQHRIIGTFRALGGIGNLLHHLGVDCFRIMHRVIPIQPTPLLSSYIIIHKTILSEVRELTTIRHPSGKI